MKSEILDFLNQCHSPYHTVEAVITQLLTPAGFQACDSASRNDLATAPSYGYMTKEDGAILAYKVGEKFTPETGSMIILASHTDSPCLRARPNSKMEAENCELFGVAPYGGGMWHSWFDRGLGVAGRVTLQDEKGKLVNKLARVQEPLCYIPNLCVHLQTADELRAFQVNKEDHLRPVVATLASKEANDKTSLRYSPTILRKVAESLGIDPAAAAEKILAWDLCLFDTQPSRVGGANGEFVESQGLDNRSSVFANFKALVDTPVSCSDKLIIAVAFDHEEVGSTTNAGAGSRLLQDWLTRLLSLICPPTTPETISHLYTRSVIVSCDAAHAVHPNYAQKHQAQNKPQMQGGVVVKVNVNQRYATTTPLIAFVRQMALKHNLKTQEFVVRNDSPCGSTIGPMSAAATLIQTIDCGIPIWAMHSIRELGGLSDIESLYRFGVCFYEHWTWVADALPPVNYDNNV